MNRTQITQIKTGVIGYPVGHSLSPLVHNHWIKSYGFNAAYEKIETAPEDLEQALRRMADEGYIGFNVTIPHKQTIAALCDTIAETARRIGAVNTVTIDENGKLHGMNTDSFGFVENILQSDAVPDIRNGKAMVLGAGGAARAIVHGLLSMGAGEIKIANRTRQKAEEIAHTFPVKVIDWAAREKEAGDIGMLVNTTALGMTGQDELIFDVEELPQEAVVCDIVYRPLHTALLQNAARRGNPVVTGIGMLLHQARPAFKEWFGVMPEVSDELLEEIKSALE